MATWCLHKFPCNAHSYVQQACLVKGSGTLYVVLRCCWLCTIHAWLVSFESYLPWVIWVSGINVAFSKLIFTMCSTALFFINPHFFILVVYVMSCNYCCEFPHQPINPPISNLFYFQRGATFQCPMVRFNWCLCVLVWMWHLSKPHHPQIYNNIHPHAIVKSIIGVFTLIRVNILGYAQHGGTTIMD
jgi:hypothetical protein